MLVYYVYCKHCGYRWKVSDVYLDDGREIICPSCGCPHYVWDATDEIEADHLEETEW